MICVKNIRILCQEIWLIHLPITWKHKWLVIICYIYQYSGMVTTILWYNNDISHPALETRQFRQMGRVVCDGWRDLGGLSPSHSSMTLDLKPPIRAIITIDNCWRDMNLYSTTQYKYRNNDNMLPCVFCSRHCNNYRPTNHCMVCRPIFALLLSVPFIGVIFHWKIITKVSLCSEKCQLRQ